ncbi:Hypothetical predicted protein, partial [Pelobates cultripes]
FHQDPQPEWLVIESTYTEGQDITTLAWLPRSHRPKYRNMLPTTRLSLSLWDKHQTKSWPSEYPSPAMKLQALTTLIPYFNAKTWTSHGVTHLHQLLDKGNLISFERLQTEYQVPKTLLFSHIQIKSWFHKYHPPKAQPEQSTQLSTAEQMCLQTKPPNKPMSQLYHEITRKAYLTKPSFIAAWELDLNMKLTDTQWLHIFSANKNLKMCASHVEISRKILYRWHIVPTKLKRINAHPQVNAGDAWTNQEPHTTSGGHALKLYPFGHKSPN